MSVKVEVFIPPPVEPGEAPINIKKMNIKSIGVPIIEKSTVLKPAVLAVIDWKNEVINCPPSFIPFRVFSCSRK